MLPEHLIITARAGTGKTTTLIEGLKLLKGQEPAITPSEPQKAIWDELLRSSDATSVSFVAFGKAIARTLKQRVPKGVNASTLHGFGFSTISRNFSLLPGDDGVNKDRVQNIIALATGRDVAYLKANYMEQMNATEELVGLCKMNLFDGTDKNQLDELCCRHGIETGDSTDKIFNMIPKILNRCKKVSLDRYIDYNDMIWLPIVLNLPIHRYDLLLVDEAQDLNPCQQEFALRAGRRLILCGDDKQAIFGFAGADSSSLPNMFKKLSSTAQGCNRLPLNMTRRCGRLIVEEARKIVPDFEWCPTNGEGKVTETAYLSRKGSVDFRDSVHDGDMVLCRVNAPLVSEVFAFIRRGKKANIKGRDIGTGLIKLVNRIARMPATNSEHGAMEMFIAGLERWSNLEIKKELAKPSPSDTKIQGILDRKACLTVFTEECDTVGEIIAKIKDIFTDTETEGIILSSIHKAKGLEANRVFLLIPPGAKLPSDRVTNEQQYQEELNLLYVAITRAITELIYVR